MLNKSTVTPLPYETFTTNDANKCKRVRGKKVAFYKIHTEGLVNKTKD